MFRKCGALILWSAAWLPLLAAGIAGQKIAGQPQDTSKDDILILVNLTASELKFDAVPDPKVGFPGTNERATVWVTDRFNLPERIEPGVTYRNIGMTLRISSRFADIEQIVREALGEGAAATALKSGTVRRPNK